MIYEEQPDALVKEELVSIKKVIAEKLLASLVACSAKYIGVQILAGIWDKSRASCMPLASEFSYFRQVRRGWVGGADMVNAGSSFDERWGEDL